MSVRAAKVRLSVKGKRADPALWFDETVEVSLGCVQCVERDRCGGLSVKAGVSDCMAFCCKNPAECKKYACPAQGRRYVDLIRDVGGFQLWPFRGSVSRVVALPDFVPALLDRGSICGPLPLRAVAVSLYGVLDMNTGMCRYANRQQVLDRFRLGAHCRLVVDGVKEDRPVERFWTKSRARRTAETLRAIRPSLVTTPNFSMHPDVPRHDNLLSMARIARCACEFASAGLPVAVHVNGRHPRDFARWATFLRESPGIEWIAYEFGTMGRSNTRRDWHAEQLVRLQDKVGRALQLVIRSGHQQVPLLQAAFERVVSIDTTPLMKAKFRQRGQVKDKRPHWTPWPTAPGETIDRLFLHNVHVWGRYHRLLRSRCRAEECEVPITANAIGTTMSLL